MAVVKQQLVIEADPNRPKEEIANIIAGFLQFWPGSEAMILKAVQKEIEVSIEAFEKGAKPHGDDVPGNGQQPGDGAGSSHR